MASSTPNDSMMSLMTVIPVPRLQHLLDIESQQSQLQSTNTQLLGTVDVLRMQVRQMGTEPYA